MVINALKLQWGKPVKAHLMVWHDVNERSISLVQFNHMMQFGLRVVTVRNNIAGNHATFTCPD